MKFSYALKLARTKLHTKRGTLIASIVIASLLFAALIAMVIVFAGVEKSAAAFIKKAGNDHYLVRTTPNIPYDKLSIPYDTLPIQQIREIKAFETQYYHDIAAKYKSLGLSYDPSAEIPALEPFAYADPKLPEEQRVRVNYQSPVIQALNDQKFETYQKTAPNTVDSLKKIGDKYGARGYTIAGKPSRIPTLPQLRLVQNGQEDFGASNPKTSGDFGSYGYFTNAMYNGMYTFTDQANLSRYLLLTDASRLKGIPVVVSAQEAASLFGKEVGIGKEPASASEVRTWLYTIQSKLIGQTYQSCYRNATEQSMLEKIQRDYADMKNNETNKEYQTPRLIYDTPKTACGDIQVKEDTRTAAEKRADAEAKATQQKLGTYVGPAHEMLTFQIVGVRYAQRQIDTTKSVDDYVKSLLTSQDDTSSIDIPIQLYDALPDRLKISDEVLHAGAATVIQRAQATDAFAPRVLEFNTVDDARNFLDNETCPTSQVNCDRAFVASPYGSNYLILDDIGALFSRIARIAFPLVLALAAAVMWFTVSRIMAESRKETAIYRAMGAKRRDIAAIYLLYILLVAMWIALISTVLGVAVSLAIDHLYGQGVTDAAVAAFGVIDGAPRFSLFSLNSPLLAVVIGALFAVSLSASIQPLVRNVRRSPIHDMRDE